jgi:hypothetical protein
LLTIKLPHPVETFIFENPHCAVPEIDGINTISILVELLNPLTTKVI